MNLLPRSSKEFSSSQYWEQFFRRRGERAFEWYGGYLELCAVLHKYIKPKDKVLVVGCGNSELSERLYDAGCQNLANIDVSEVVIRQMNERNANQRPNMTYQVMDATKTTFSDSHFQAVLDKGTLDAILTDTEAGTLETATRLLTEVGRVLQCGGRYLCVSLAQAHVLEKLVTQFSQGGWMVRIHQVSESSSKGSGSQFPLPVFVFVMTKVKEMPGFPQVLEMMPEDEGGKSVRCGSPSDLMDMVKERQSYALIRSHLNQNHNSPEVSLDLCDGVSGKTRYTFHVVDSPSIRLLPANHFAIFIIPQGRETEWLFGSETGRRQLAGNVGFRRLLFVALHRDQPYESMEAIQSELSAKVLELAPPGLPDNQQIPFLSAGGDIGIRTVQYRGRSEMSGEYVVEDVRGDGTSYFRRLIFLSNQNVVQSEARLLPSNTPSGQKKKRKDKKKQQKANDKVEPGITHVLDKSYLCCEHHKAMISGLSLLHNPGVTPDQHLSVLVVGLGGGSLSLFIHDYFLGSLVEAVEIDPAVLDVAGRWFGFTLDNRLKVHLADGLDHINELAQKGIFILNLVCRDPVLKKKVINTIHEVFPLIYVQKIEDEVNEILFCCPVSGQRRDLSELKESARSLEKQLKRPGMLWDETFVLADMLKSVQIV
ncbi:eEF1A lysine and N-terminal methyltransferase isoform 2-T2 [Anomaloglossus baeobatrachus]|uniref:eEF1A lysine and N-terminal methyltransferase isoform X2 n=1 Tax=Anomaloglossus baeobatrachus TaxID=238106 RepID=UPI003F4FB178